MTAAVGKVWREQKHILIQAKFSRINGNNKYISQSTRNWKSGQHKSGLTKPVKATSREFSYQSGIVIKFDNHETSQHGGHFRNREISYSLRFVRYLFGFIRVIYP